jgi:hypothetical protein
MMTRTTINDLFWTVGLLLQCSLLTLVFLRGIVRRLPLFSGLLAFYLLRSMLLFALFGKVDSAAYASTYDGLTLVDLFLQLLVTAEIAVCLERATGLFTLRRSIPLLLLPVFASAATLLLAHALPAHSPVPFDRIQAFAWSSMILLGGLALAWRAAKQPAAALPRRVALGFAFYGIAGIAASLERPFAVLARDARGLAVWSYVLPAAWVLVVVYWIAALRRPAPASYAAPTLAAAK